MPANNVGRNWKRTREDSRFGTRKLAFYALTSSTENNLVGPIVAPGYSFRVSTITGAVTFDATITERDIALMSLEFQGQNGNDYDDDTYTVSPLPFNIEFLGGGTTDAFYINSNSGISFYDTSTDREGPNTPNIGVKEIFIANNDGNMQFLYYETTGVTPNRQFRVKFKGNTDYNVDDATNLTWEAVFYESENYIDFLVTAQPTNWSAYNDGQGNVTWGVTDGSNWVDGLSDHSVSFAPMSNGSSGTAWKEPNSAFYKVLQAIQQSGAELFWVGTPHNRREQFNVDWSGLTINDTDDGFVFAIADDAENPVATLDSTWNGTVVSTNANDPNSIDLDNIPPNVYIGQRVTFSGNVFGGIVAGKDYYVRDKYTYDGDTKLTIFVSDTVEREVLDIVYPEGVGGEPGTEVELTTDTGSMTATFYNYDIEWQGTAGDIVSACCYNLTQPGVIPNRLGYFINQSGALPEYWWIERCNPSYGIFPSWQSQN